MLTFRFTGVSGEMIEKEMLVSGMVGKQIKFEFSDEWEGLRKAAVYRAGDMVCTNLDIQEIDTIPAEVLSKSLRRLYVGVYGLSEDGQVAIPTRFVPGPFIHIGAAADEGSGFDPEDPFWMEMEQALEETVRFTPQTLTLEQQAQARTNIGVSAEKGLSTAAAALLVAILRKAVYTEELSDIIGDLEEALQNPEEETAVYYQLTCSLDQVTAQPASAVVKKGEGCTVVLTAEAGYVLDTVTVTMGGSDITASAYSDGTVTIPAVTGNVVITAAAVKEEAETGMTYIAASVYTVGGVPMINFQNAANTDRACLITTEQVAATPFPVNGTSELGDLYIISVPETAGTMKVTSPGFIGGPQFFTLSEGTYTKTLDAGWQTEDGFELAITPGAHQFVVINFKKTDGTSFALADVDFTGFSILFAEAEDSGENEESAVTYPVTMSFTQVIANNNLRTVEHGAAYNNLLSPEEGYVLTSVNVTMGGVDITESAVSGAKITITQVTGAIFITAVAVPEETESGEILYLAASVYTNGGVAMINILSASSTNRLCCATKEVTADTPFPVNGTTDLGDLYILAVPETASAMKVTSPGFIGGPQFFTLADGTYTRTIDAGWQTVDSFEYAITPGANHYVVINFKKSDNSNFALVDVDTTGFAVEFV